MATSMMRVFADNYGLDTHDIAELFDCTDRTARNKLSSTPEHDLRRIIELQASFDNVISAWREEVVGSVLEMSSKADEKLIFMTQSFEKNADFKRALERSLDVDTSTGVPPIAALYNSALFQAFIELSKQGEVMMTMAYDPEDPRSVEFGMDVLSKPAGEPGKDDDDNERDEVPPAMSQEDLDKWASEGSDRPITFTHLLVGITDDDLNAPEVGDEIRKWLASEGRDLAYVLKVENDDNLEPGTGVDIEVMPKVHPEFLSEVVRQKFATDRCHLGFVAWADGHNVSIDLP